MVLSSVSGRSVRLSAIIAGSVAALIASSMVDDAEARSRQKKVRAPAYSPPFASLVVDANTGKVLHSQNADALRHPASITKVMTLYMLFDQMEKRRFTLASEIPVTAHAASMPPTRLGLRPGSTITVENAIKSIVTHSANDMAAAVGEAIAGSEDKFAVMMTQKARSLGMTRTNFENASGLPNPDQVTTAHDLAILGRAMRERFPQYYHFFSTSSFQFGRMAMRNHNRLLGKIEGVDGIKTGYTRASGFNLLTSARRGNRRIIAVVLGGSSAGRRDAMMANLVETYIDRASGVRTMPAFAERETTAAPVTVAAMEITPPKPPARLELARAELPVQPAAFITRAESETARPLALAAYSRTEPARPAVISAAPRTGDLIPTASIPYAPDGSTRSRSAATTAATTASRSSTPSTLRWLSGPAAAESAPAAARPEFIAAPAPPAATPPANILAATPAARVTPMATPAPAPVRIASVEIARSRPAAAAHGFMIQIGATDDIEKAKDLLDRARSRSNGQLARAKSFTEQMTKGGETLYRARFAGLDEKAAEAACKTLKRSGLGCFATRN